MIVRSRRHILSKVHRISLQIGRYGNFHSSGKSSYCKTDLLVFESGEQAHGASHELRPGSLQGWGGSLLRQGHQGNEPQQVDLLVIHLAEVLRAATRFAGKDHLQPAAMLAVVAEG